MIDEEAVRQAVLTKAKKFWSKKQVDKMVLTNFEPDDCNHYMMESFREARKTKEKSEPFGSSAEQRHQENMNSLSTLPPGQVPPTLWSIIVEPDQDFIQQKKLVKCLDLAEFESVENAGAVAKSGVTGATQLDSKSARPAEERDGETWPADDTKRSDYYTDHDGVPAQKLEQVNGTVRFSDCRAIIVPFEDHPCTEINEASQIFWREHNAPDESLPLPFRLLKHRHFIEIIPIVKGKIKLGEKIYDFSVIGNEHVCDIVKKPSRCSLL